MSESYSFERPSDPEKKKRRSNAPAGESDQWIKKTSNEIWKFLQQKSVLNKLMALDKSANRTFTIPSDISIFRSLFLYCISQSALPELDSDYNLKKCDLTDHEKSIKEFWEKHEADNKLIGRKKTQNHNRGREHTLKIQKQVASGISKERAERIKDAVFYGYILEPNVTGAESGPPGDENDPQAANSLSQEQPQLDDQIEVGLADVVQIDCTQLTQAGDINKLEDALNNLSDLSLFADTPIKSCKLSAVYENYAQIVPFCDDLYSDIIEHVTYEPPLIAPWKCSNSVHKTAGFVKPQLSMLKSMICHGCRHHMQPPDAKHKKEFFICPVCSFEKQSPSGHFAHGYGLESCMEILSSILCGRFVAFFMHKYGVDIDP